MIDDPIVFIDTETDGVRAGRRTWEISWIHRAPTHDGTIIDAQATVIITDSGVTGREEPVALEVNRYEERFNRELWPGERRMSGEHAARLIHAGTHGAWLVGAQPQFDDHGLRRLLDWYGLVPQWKRRLRDIESMSEAHLGRFGIGGLQDCARALGIEVDPAKVHTSAGDVELTRDCFDRIFPAQPV